MVVVRFLFTISIIDLHRLLRDGQERKELLLIYEDLYHLCSVDDCLMFYGWMDGWMDGWPSNHRRWICYCAEYWFRNYILIALIYGLFVAALMTKMAAINGM